MSRRGVLAAGVALAVAAGAAVWFVAHRVDHTAVTVASHTLDRWTLTVSDGSDPWIVAMKPPDTLTSSLFAQASRRSGRTLIAPAHAALPLVLRSEFDEGLQGVYGTDSVLRIAREAGIENGTFKPVCLAHRRGSASSSEAELYFVPFESAAFNAVRSDLVPAEPEHAGIGIYDPATLTPLLIVGATNAALEQWWPLAFDPAKDCEADVDAVPSP